MKKYRTTGSIATVDGRADVKIVKPEVSMKELFDIEAQNGCVLMPTAAERAAIDASRAYDATFVADSDFDDDDDDITDEEVETFLRELAKSK